MTTEPVKTHPTSRAEPLREAATWTCRCGRTVLLENRSNHLLRQDGTHGEPNIDVERLADVLTEYHLRSDGYCSESHRADAEWMLERLAALSQQSEKP